MRRFLVRAPGGPVINVVRHRDRPHPQSTLTLLSGPTSAGVARAQIVPTVTNGGASGQSGPRIVPGGANVRRHADRSPYDALPATNCRGKPVDRQTAGESREQAGSRGKQGKPVSRQTARGKPVDSPVTRTQISSPERTTAQGTPPPERYIPAGPRNSRRSGRRPRTSPARRQAQQPPPTGGHAHKE